MRLLQISLVFIVLFADWIISQDVDRNCPPLRCSDSKLRKSIGMTPHCHCDDQCGDYNDCCSDAPNKEKSTNETLYSCTPFSIVGSFLLKRYCPNSSKKNQIKCAQSANYSDHIQQMHLKIPVTSKINNITYGNIFCAFCDNVTKENLSYWNLKIVCGRWRRIITNFTFGGPDTFLKNQPELKKVLKFNNDTKQWRYVNGSVTANCTMLPQVPLSLQKVVRPCVFNLTSNCPSNFLVTNITNKCAEFQSTVYQRSVSTNDYRNAYCALCNGVPLRNLSCYVPTPSTIRPYRRYTRRPPPTGPKIMKPRTYLYIAMKSNCEYLLNEIELTKIKAETVVYKTMNRTFIRNSTSINGTGIQICHINNETFIELEESKLNSSFFRIVVNLGCLSAGTFLLLHIWNFFASNEPAQMNQKLLLSFAIAMLLGNVGFLYESLSNIALSDHLIICAIDNFITYYGFLAAFLWISSMAFDISCSVWSFAFNQTTVLSKHGTTLFVVYSLISWMLPALISLTFQWYDSIKSGDTAYFCMLTKEVTLLWYFVMPLTVSMSVNLAFYLCTVFVVFTEEGVIEKMSKAGIEFKLHTFLVMTTNIMWLTIVLAGYLDNHSLVVLFTVCDVFLCFILFWSPFGKDVGIKSEMLLKPTTNHTVKTPESVKQ
ncbi:hypothetical protein V9T40_009414 [Parthenolecanium corni]|uniref:G-protein coupled receptors family 2 profile 2 domain-containing protein n=1 Tax=Parthenolecanium corni TaxID=536013 RepID=A0AAN9U110_9HEMI